VLFATLSFCLVHDSSNHAYNVAMLQNNKWYFTASSILFTVIAIAHLGQINFMLEATIAGYVVPLWISGAAVIIAGYLATRGFMEAYKL